MSLGLAPWPALVLKLGSVVEETDDEEEPVQRTTDIGILKEQRAGLPVAEIYRCHGISDETFYTWRSRFGGMEVSDAGRLKSLDEENRKLKKLLAEAMLDVAALREALGKKLLTPGARRTAVSWAIEEKGYSQRRACGLIELAPKTYRYASTRGDDAPVRVRLRSLAGERRWFGSRRLLISARGGRASH
ncbi:hypothetical protein LNAOJCKE_4451 [Methylorubrum aminovorans]|uniref:Transposase n=1 Tax=Methylorubrum aminovorans TaxID=269069 RepID=A0ABQ4UKT5_9HYPH|nr:hypothetical protein LNAOJCKE_4451 [Methylorubrum aminovorans]